MTDTEYRSEHVKPSPQRSRRSIPTTLWILKWHCVHSKAYLVSLRLHVTIPDMREARCITTTTHTCTLVVDPMTIRLIWGQSLMLLQLDPDKNNRNPPASSSLHLLGKLISAEQYVPGRCISHPGVLATSSSRVYYKIPSTIHPPSFEEAPLHWVPGFIPITPAC